MELMSLILIGLGALMIFRPQIWYELTEGWKHSSGSEPSALYLRSTRFGGVMCALVGIVSLAAEFFS